MRVKSVVFLLLVVVATSLGQKKCCYPDQYEALDGTVVGTVESGEGVALRESIQFAFDYTNRRTGQFSHIQEGTRIYTYQLIMDYKKGVGYIIDLKTKKCQKVPLPKGNMTHCIPEDATYTGSYYFGDHKLTADSFLVPVEGEVVGSATLSVSEGDCIPLGVTFIGTQGQTPVLEVAGFVNYTSGIQDPSKYFTVPSYCSQSFSTEPKMYKSFLHKLIAFL